MKEEPTPVAVLEAEVQRKMDELREQMEASRKKIAGIMQEMQLIKTTVREKIVVPLNLDYSEAVLDE
jgi:ABC-type methionine transport system ATPase subunit